MTTEIKDGEIAELQAYADVVSKLMGGPVVSLDLPELNADKQANLDWFLSTLFLSTHPAHSTVQ